MFIVRKTKRKRRAKAASGSLPPPAAPETLDAEVGHAPPPDARAPKDDSSVQDPLEDWPDDDQDRWLRERSGGDIEKSGE